MEILCCGSYYNSDLKRPLNIEMATTMSNLVNAVMRRSIKICQRQHFLWGFLVDEGREDPSTTMGPTSAVHIGPTQLCSAKNQQDDSTSGLRIVKYRALVSPTLCPRLQNINMFVLFHVAISFYYIKVFFSNIVCVTFIIS